MSLKAPTMNSGVAFYHSLWVGAQWYNTSLKHWHKHSASLEAEEIHKAANNFKEGTSYEKTPFSWLVSAKREIFLPLLNPQENMQCPFWSPKLPHHLNMLLSLKHVISTSHTDGWGRWARPADRALLRLGTTPSIPNSSQLWVHPTCTLQCFSTFLKAFESRREKVAGKCMKNLVVDWFRLV